MVKNLKRYRKQVERDQGKLEAQKYPFYAPSVVLFRYVPPWGPIIRCTCICLFLDRPSWIPLCSVVLCRTCRHVPPWGSIIHFTCICLFLVDHCGCSYILLFYAGTYRYENRSSVALFFCLFLDRPPWMSLYCLMSRDVNPLRSSLWCFG